MMKHNGLMQLQAHICVSKALSKSKSIRNPICPYAKTDWSKKQKTNQSAGIEK